MELAITISLAFLEMTFVMVGLLLLHGLRKQIGVAGFYIAIGTLFVLTQIVNATSIKLVIGYRGADFYIANTVLLLPFLAAIMVVYITEGTLTTQRLIIGSMLTLGFYLYLSHLTALQCAWEGFTISQGPSSDSLRFLLTRSQRTMAGSILALALDFFLIPIFFQRLRNLGCRLFFAILGSLMLTQIADTVVSVTASYWGDPMWWFQMNSSYIAKAVATIWMSVLVSLYLSRIEREMPGEGRGTLDIVLAFFGAYGKAQALQKHILEWEGRYRMVIENASDMILIVDRDGAILDGNPAANRMLHGKGGASLAGRSFLELAGDKDALPFNWDALWDASATLKPGSAPNLQLKMLAFDGTIVEVDTAFSKVKFTGNPVLIVFGRDITERNRLTHEKNELSEQLFHAQRLESVGHLAGGIAHDFNNLLHAIRGHIDLLIYFGGITDSSVLKHLESVGGIIDKAGKVTAKLLGFARKGRYHEGVVDLRDVLNETKEMFMPLTQNKLTLSMEVPEHKCEIVGDSLQLQQVFMNLLINAMDATEENPSNSRYIHIALRQADVFPADWRPLKHDADPADYYEAVVKDNGAGMDTKTISHIFEPFYTTKPVGKGTGMGLALVYGQVTGHKGFIHAKSQKGSGSTFYIYLPKLRENFEDTR